MRIGVFDSGLGGLAIARAIMTRLPQYDYLYLGDTKRVPYGNRSQATIHEFTSEALDFLFGEDCHLVILACNTASAEALRKSQQEYLPNRYPDRRVLGVVIPCAESALDAVGACVPPKIGVLATASTVESNAYVRELTQRNPLATVVQRAAPLLVPIVENDGLKYVDPILRDYLDDIGQVDSLILGCTHYVLLKDKIRAMVPYPVLSPDEVVPEKLADYLARHPEHESRLSRNGSRRYTVTDWTESYQTLASRFSGENLHLERVSL